MNEDGHPFLSELEDCLSAISDDLRVFSFSAYFNSYYCERFNEVAFRSTFATETSHNE